MADKPQVEPYDFVPLVGKPERKLPVGHDRYGEHRYSGLLECRLTARTPLFVYDPRFVHSVDQGHEMVDFPVFQGVAVISGASLKGVIRSVVESIEACCFTLPSPFPRKYRGSGITRDKEIAVRLPAGFEHCHEKVEIAKGQYRPKALCPACRLFGSLDPEGEWAYAGKVSIGDACSQRGEYTLMTRLTLDVLSTPKPEGRPKAYTLNDGQTIKGRKFYRHRYPPDVLTRVADRSGRPKRDQQNKTVQPVKEGSVFYFTVEYDDLDDAELRLLLYALALEDGLWHKVGLGKPIGLGSVQIEIIMWTQIDRQARYRALGGGVAASLEGEALKAKLTEWLRPYRQNQTEPIKKLRDILRPDPNADVRYIVQRPPARERGRW
jgi:CRISPR/Cas system CSM-associated protein Csm3 (group 7 of RAMP superfamily)